MKKFLSLVLALVMTMSLVTISAGAEDFTDDASINYEEAVDVMSAVGVVGGYADGSFNPTAGLSRGAAAKIICNMILGPTTAAALSADTAPYKDVATDNTYAGYIAYCAQQGIISGYTDGTFRPYAPLTGYAFQKMLLGALGYDADVEGYNQPNWSIAVAKQALGIGLNAGLKTDFNGAKAVTREEACLFAFNTLKATMVEYDTVINIGDVTIAGSQAKNVAQTGYKNTMGGANLQFAEKYFTKLTVTPATDVFGRPATKWVNNKKEVGTYVDYTELVGEFTGEVTGKDLYDLLGSTAIKNSTVNVYVDGETEQSILGGAYFTAGKMIKTNTKIVGATDEGVLTQVFQDVENDEINVVIINTYLAKVEADYSEKQDDADLTVYMIDDENGSATVEQYAKEAGQTESLNVKGEDFAIVETLKEDDIVLVTVADGAIQSIEKPEVIAETAINSFKAGSHLTVDGEKYTFSETLQYDSELVAYTDGVTYVNLKDALYNVYLDQYGYVIGIEEVNGKTNYLFMTGFDGKFSNLSQKTADVGVIFMDGTMDVVKVDVDDSTAALFAGLGNTDQNKAAATVNTWCSYTVDKNGVYTLTQVDTSWAAGDGNSQRAHTTASTVIDKKHIILPGSGTMTWVYGNDNSTYIVVDTETIAVSGSKTATIIDDVDSVATGVQNVNLVPTAADATTPTLIGTSGGVYTMFDKYGYVVAAIVVGENDSASKNYAYVTSTNVNLESYDPTADEYTWSRDVVIDGELTTIEYKGDKLNQIGTTGTKTMAQGEWYEVKYYADGTVKETNALAFGTANDKFENIVDNIDTLLAAPYDYETIVLSDVSTATKLTCIGSTLFVTTSNTEGFVVASDVDVFLGLKIDGTEFKKINDYEGIKGLEKAIKDLDANNETGFAAGDVEVNAIIENGVATTVILNDKTGTTTVEGTDINATGDVAILNLTYSAGQFNATTAAKKNVTATTWTMSVYQNGILVGQTANAASGNWTANTAYGLSAATSVPVGGEYDVVVTIYNGATVAATGTATFTI